MIVPKDYIRVLILLYAAWQSHVPENAQPPRKHPSLCLKYYSFIECDRCSDIKVSVAIFSPACAEEQRWWMRYFASTRVFYDHHSVCCVGLPVSLPVFAGYYIGNSFELPGCQSYEILELLLSVCLGFFPIEWEQRLDSTSDRIFLPAHFFRRYSLHYLDNPNL